jgi:hypothetical protein
MQKPGVCVKLWVKRMITSTCKISLRVILRKEVVLKRYNKAFLKVLLGVGAFKKP